LKILVIGGGIAGATAARLLASHYDVTLIQDKVWEKPCGGGVKTKIFDQFGLDKSQILHSLDKVYMIYKNSKIEIPLFGKNLSIVNRKLFDSHLRDLAQKNGAKIYYGRFKEFKNKKALIKIANENVLFDYDILIAADGVNSSVRKALNLPSIPKTITHYAKTTDYSVSTCEFFFDREIGGKYYAWAFPQKTHTHIGSVSKENFSKLCEYLNVTLKPKGYFIPTWEENVIMRKENIYFVGDSAAQVMPLSFEGIYYAMHSAKILAQSIIKNEDYVKNWQKRFLKEFKFMKTLEKINQTPFRGFIVNLHRFEFMKKLSVKLWLGAKNV